MPQCITTYSFPGDLEITDKMVFDFLTKIDYYWNQEILKHFNVSSLDSVTFMKIKDDLIKEQCYGWDDGGWKENLYKIVSIIMSDKNLAESFQFIKIDKKWDNEGSDTYDYYEYVSTDKHIKDALSIIEKEIKVLEKYGKKVKFVIE